MVKVMTTPERRPSNTEPPNIKKQHREIKKKKKKKKKKTSYKKLMKSILQPAKKTKEEPKSPLPTAHFIKVEVI